mmetsp:Transcript_9211/g.23655  ORF Transcript_9211/g.23655 Transcript_9211/m.23655 type:complete len:227 (+) Transcript_9211:438-1118(+)
MINDVHLWVELAVVTQLDASQDLPPGRLGGRFGVLQFQLVVFEVPLLRWQRQALPIVGSLEVVERHGFLRSRGVAQVQEQATHHQPGAALASLAVDHDDIVNGVAKPLLGRVAKTLNQAKRGAVVVIERERGHLPIKQGHVVGPFRAQVVDFVAIAVVLVQEHDDVLHVVPINPFDEPEHAAGFIPRWKPHRDDVFCDVRQIQIKAIMLESLLVFGHESPGEPEHL